MTAADANFRYMLKTWPHSDRPAASEQYPPATHSEAVPQMVKHMSQEVAGIGRNATIDRFFTSVPLVEKLMAKRLTILGTINIRRKLV